MPNKYIYGIGTLVLGYLYFNRNPDRKIPLGNNLVAPSDGTVKLIDNKIEIFIGLLDVHYQRTPCDGYITNVIERNSNNRNIIELSTAFGNITIERWSGFMARTVMTFVRTGDYINKGDRLGRILLGSHCTITIPNNLSIVVNLGQHLLAGRTIIAE